MSSNLEQRLINHLSEIYPEDDHQELAHEIMDVFWPQSREKILKNPKLPDSSVWSEKTTLMITYGDSIVKKGEKPLQTLHSFLTAHFKKFMRCVHILPFFPYSSDDGFAVMDYENVREDLGDWTDIQAIGQDFQLMSDLVINHASAQGDWFKGFLDGQEEYREFFFEASPDDDLSHVIRPRPSPLLVEFDSAEGMKHLWCTFGPDQVDLNFANPRVLIEFIKIMRLYLDNQVRIFRLDAVAFLWKEVGTSSIHLPQTHEIIRLLRTLTDFFHDEVLLITETNVPNHENLTYFGNQNEAHLIYNFSLPPLLIQALITGNEYYLKKWLMEMPPTQKGCAYLNFVAGHDGIGLRPATGILMEEDLTEMIDTMRSFGGEVSMRSVAGGEERPYELNIALYDALKGTIEGEDEYQRERFLASQAIMMALEGVPAFYIHSLLATKNDYEKFKKSGHKRCINRHRWDFDQLEQLLNDPKSDQSYILGELSRMIEIRTKQKSFHPNATQFTLHLPEGFFGFWRQSLDRKQDTFCITNLTKHDLSLPLHSLNMHIGVKWGDLLTGQMYDTRDQEVVFNPYQTMWISSHASSLF
ncbi:MAG: sugar phosphorylase [Alphaproteobacteria bacterium]|nr:sugar phosphorylase [Alphaproteobacteria bacterium]